MLDFPPPLTHFAPIGLITQASNSQSSRLQWLVKQATESPYYAFQPRPDVPAEFDEQTSFVADTTSRFAILLGGTGAGKTAAASFKTAHYVLTKRPHRESWPFWIIGETMEQICNVGWVEKLSRLIPESEILSIDWWKSSRKWPRAVILRHPEKRFRPGWVLEFRSYEQGIDSMKGASIGGYWFNEEVPFELVAEVQGRTRETGAPGWADFTPVVCKSAAWPEAYERPPAGWKFYHVNTEKNWALENGWAEWYLSQVPEDMREMRRIGAFTTMQGQIFKEFRKTTHVISWEQFEDLTGHVSIPRDWFKIRGIDFGFANPFCCLWVARNSDGTYFVYDEHYASQKQIAEHAHAINKRGWGSPGSPWHGPTYSDHDAQVRHELKTHGVICSLAAKMNINAGIEALRKLMMIQANGKPRLYVLDTCENLVREIPGYKWSESTSVKNARETPIDMNNHAIDAMRYAIYSDWLKLQKSDISTGKVWADAKKHGVQFAR